MATYLTLFANEAAYNAAKDNLQTPNVSYCEQEESVQYKPVQPSPTPTVNLVDLGLPSGNLWADRNVGASSVEDFGMYFSWGNTTGQAISEDATFGEPDEYDRLKKSYDEQKAQLSTCTGYTDWGGA